MTTGRNLSLKTLVARCIVTLSLGLLAACSGGGGGTSDSGSSATSTGFLKLSITDKPSDNYAQVVVAIKEVRVVPAGKDDAADDDAALPIVVSYPTPKVVDVMQLQFVQQALGEIALLPGSYSQIRLILAPNPSGQGQEPLNYLTLKNAPAAKIALKTPSGQQSGLKVLGPMEVKANVVTAVAIDFDPNTAIVARGNGQYNLKPTGIRLVQTSASLGQYGSFGGTVSATFKDWSSATVAIKRRGSINDTDPIASGRIFSSYTSGRWEAPFVAFVPPSTDTVSYKAFISANGFQLYSTQAVAVSKGVMTDAGSIPLSPQ